MDVEFHDFIDSPTININKIITLSIVGLDEDGYLFGPNASIWYPEKELDNPDIKSYVCAHISYTWYDQPVIVTNFKGWVEAFISSNVKRPNCLYIPQKSLFVRPLTTADRSILQQECTQYLL